MDIEIKADVIAVHGVPPQVSVRDRTASASAAPPPLPDLLADKNILVVGINYAPEPTGIAPYTTAMCEYLATRARLVTVLTGLPHYPGWQVPRTYKGFRRNPEQHTPSLHVIRHKHYVPQRMSALTRGAYEASFLARVRRTHLDERPDLVVAVTPSLSGAVAGARMAQRYRCPLVVLVQDLMAKAASQSGISGGGAVAGTTARVEQKALAAADRVLIVSEAFRSQLHDYGISDEKIELVPNWSHITPSPMSAADAKKALGWPAKRFAVVHTGNMGFKQGLTTAIEAAAELAKRDEPVDLVLVGDGSQRKALQAMAKGMPNVRFVGPVGEDEYPTVLAAADLLLLCERPSVADMSLPSKLTSYLVAGRPIVASVAPGGATARELARVDGSEIVGAGKGWDLADAIAILRLAEERRDQMAEAGRLYAEANLCPAAGLRRVEATVLAVLAPA